MKLTCPNCDAQYEIDDDLIPANGREVQCSDCGHTWFHGPERPKPAPQGDASVSDDTPVPPAPPVRGSGLSPDVAEILREEAAHERRARGLADRKNETQPAPAPPAPANSPPDTKAELGLEPKPVKVKLQPVEPWPEGDGPHDKNRRRAGFKWGFLLIMALALLAVAAYFLASSLDPALNPYLAGSAARYVDWVDDMRAAVASAAGDLRQGF